MSHLHLVKDKNLMSICNDFTRKSLERGVKLNTICAIVKNFQQFYAFVESIRPDLLNKCTMELLYELTDGFTKAPVWSGALEWSKEEVEEFMDNLART
jgi:hypothetical protein